MATSIDSGGFQRNPEDYLARQKAQEEEERLEKSKYQRRYHGEKRSEKNEKDVKRRSYIPPKTADSDAQKAARDYREKRRSLHLDKQTNKTADLNLPKAPQRGNRQANLEKKNELNVQTDTSETFAPISASSPRAAESSKSPRSPRSPTSPSRPSSKRKAAPPPPCLQSPKHTSVEQPLPPSKIPAPSVAEQPNRPPRRKRKDSSENKSFVHTSFEKDQETQSKEVAVYVNVTINDTPSKKKDLNFESDSKAPVVVDVKDEEPKLETAEIISIDIPKSDVDEIVLDSELSVTNGDKEESLFDSIVNALPNLKQDPKEVVIPEATDTDDQTSVSPQPVNGHIDETIVATTECLVEGEIKPVKLDHSKGRLIPNDIKSDIEFEESVISKTTRGDSDSDSEDYKAVRSGLAVDNKDSEIDVVDGYLDYIKPVSFKKADDLQLTFQKISYLPQVEKSKDNRDNISITSETSSTGSEAPPLPDSAPPPLPLTETSSLTKAPSLTEVSEEVEVIDKIVQEDMEVIQSVPAESKSAMMTTEQEEVAEVPTSESDEPISPRSLSSPERAMSPIADLDASLFSMRVKSPTRDLTSPTRDITTNGELHVDVNSRRHVTSDSDISDSEQDQFDTFSPGDIQTNMVPTKTDSIDEGDIQLVSYNTKLYSPNSDHSAVDSAFEDMLSSMTSNDPLSSTLDDLTHEEIVVSQTTEKSESSPPKPKPNRDVITKDTRKFELALDNSGRTYSPGSRDFMAKAQQFANVVQKPPKVTVKLKREITSPDDLSDEQCLQMEAERRAVLSSSKMKRRDVETSHSIELSEHEEVESYPYTDEAATQEWQADVSKRGSIEWEEKPDKVNLYSENVTQEEEISEAVDRDSIANLQSTRKQWENIFNANVSEQVTPKRKQPSKVRHWDVKLPTPSTKVPENVVTVNKTVESESESDHEEEENMADVDNANESAIEREIRLAMEREDMLRKEQDEREELKLRQESAIESSAVIKPVDKSVFEMTTEENNNRPSYLEMTEADRGSELTQREEQIQAEMQQQEQRESQIVQDRQQDSDHSSSEDEANSNESIIEREIRLQQEREQELTTRMKTQATVKEPEQEPDREPEQEVDTEESEEEVVVVETVEVAYVQPVRESPSSVSSSDDLSGTESPEETPAEIRTRISYEEAISSSSHQGESLIARELREAREREEELTKQQIRVSGNFQNTQSEPATPQTQSVPNKETDAVKPTYQKDVSPYKQTIAQSQDSLSSHSTEKSPASSYIPPKQAGRVGAFGDISSMSFNKTPDKKEKSKEKKPETPIEREIRLARERENEYLGLQGRPLLPEVKRDEAGSDDDQEKGVATPPRAAYVRTPSSADSSLRGFASSRLQKEIKQQSERERKYQSEGKIISTSEQHVGLVKYTEMTPQQVSAPPKRNFSITRKPVVEQSPEHKAPEQNGVPDNVKTTQKPEKPETNKFARSISSGGSLTFSYRESRHRAESKIEQELREMREREDELRSQREGAGIVTPRDPDSPRSPSSNSVTNKRSQFEQTV